MIRHGAKHDIYHNPKTGISQPIPRHREINEILAKKILRDLSNPSPYRSILIPRWLGTKNPSQNL
ncbi:MAG: hypothetical protein KIT39_03365 [Nitrospirales bacterium]|nr:hypothetical protein [Nitrospirales bacterium]